MCAALRSWLALIAAGVLGFPGAASAEVTFTFSDYTNPPVVDPSPTAQVTYGAAGNVLTVTVNNTSAYDVRGLYFNMDATAGIVGFIGPVSEEWTYEGNVTAQGFGNFNWNIDFGFAPLTVGSVTTFALELDGPATDAGFQTYSDVTDGGTAVLAAVTFQAEPGSEVTVGTVIGGSVTTGGGEPNPVPAPAGLPLFALGLAGLAWARRRA